MPTIVTHPNALFKRTNHMLLILFEALGAGLLLVFIVWWTMFHGRSGGEPDKQERDKD